MNKILTLFKREYKAAVKTKTFIISLIIVPILMGGSFLVMMIMEDKVDTDDKKMVVIDHSGELEQVLKNAADTRNENTLTDPETGEQILPEFVLEFAVPDSKDPFNQKLELSERVRSKELHAFIEIGSEILDSVNTENSYLRYYSEHSFMDDIRYWFSNTINDYLRQKRFTELNLPEEVSEKLFAWMNIEGMGLVNVDKKTGEMQEAEKTNELTSFLVPYIIVILMFMLTMMNAIPLLTAVMEEKTEKIAEVLLGTITPFQFMMGKVLGGIGVSLTTASVYVGGGIFIAIQAGHKSLIPFDVLPWFFVFIILYILMVGSGMAALGASCNDNKDAQNIQFPAMMPVMLPLFLLVPIIQNPTGSLATTLSLIPPFTPTIMMLRMATPVTIPMWQPILGLFLVVLFTIFSIWLGAKIFRTAILIQGQKPSIKNLISYAFKK